MTYRIPILVHLGVALDFREVVAVAIKLIEWDT